MICPKCKAQLPAGAISCQKCGTKFKTKVCPHCKAVILAGAQVCPKCGRALSSQAQGAKSKWKKPLTKRWWFWAACAFLVIGIIGNIGNAAAALAVPSRRFKRCSEALLSRYVSQDRKKYCWLPRKYHKGLPPYWQQYYRAFSPVHLGNGIVYSGRFQACWKEPKSSGLSLPFSLAPSEC